MGFGDRDDDNQRKRCGCGGGMEQSSSKRWRNLAEVGCVHRIDVDVDGARPAHDDSGGGPGERAKPVCGAVGDLVGGGGTGTFLVGGRRSWSGGAMGRIVAAGDDVAAEDAEIKAYETISRNRIETRSDE